MTTSHPPKPDFESAGRYALQRLESELDPALCFHNIAHTRDSVLPAAERLAALECIQPEQLLLLRTAACFHDLGYLEQYFDNEQNGVVMAREMLPGFGYSPAQVQTISGLILATRLPQSPTSALEEILADADLDSLGRNDFWELSEALRREQAAFSSPVSDGEWVANQVKFLQSHRYFTKSARMLREGKKQEHLTELLKQLKELQPSC
jgi:uncharacterized protein